MERNTWKRLALPAVLGLVVVQAADAGTPQEERRQEIRRQVESSRLVSGTITISKEGAVLEYQLDATPPVEPAVRALIDKAVAKWKFSPVLVDGQAVLAKVPMNLRLVASPIGNGEQVSVRIASTHFGGTSKEPVEGMTIAHRPAASYPRAALRAHVGGTVYVVLRIGRDGRVLDVATEQVNLRAAGPEKSMRLLRADLATATEHSVRQWRFSPPTQGPEANQDEWIGRVTFSYHVNPGSEGPPVWDTYVPGPRNTAIPWAEDKLRTAGSPDAMPDGGFQTLGSGPRLLDPAAG
jgi:hypothetical protein